MDNSLFLDEFHDTIERPKETSSNSLNNQMIAIGKSLVRAKKSMSLEERKLLTMALTKIKWTKANNDLQVQISKEEIEQVMNWQIDINHRSVKIRNLAKKLALHSWIAIDGQDKESWNDGFLVKGSSSERKNIYINLNEQFRTSLENLATGKDFITMWSNDIYKFNSIYAYLLYEELRLHCDTRKTNWRTYTTKELKELFEIPKDGKGSYMRPKEKGGFDRANFEKYVLDVAIKEINQGDMIQIQPFVGMEAKKDRPNKYNKLYAKLKDNGLVSGYQFKYVVRTHTERSFESF